MWTFQSDLDGDALLARPGIEVLAGRTQTASTAERQVVTKIRLWDLTKVRRIDVTIADTLQMCR